MMAETKAKIEKHIRKHRKSGGPVSGDNDAEKDLKDTPTDRTGPNNIAKEAKEMKAKKGGRIKKEVGMAEGSEGHHHAGRKRRASGGGCESSPFTSAMRGSPASGRKTMSESKGANT